MYLFCLILTGIIGSEDYRKYKPLMITPEVMSKKFLQTESVIMKCTTYPQLSESRYTGFAD